ncbi:hypothetical protein AUL54_08115 [Bacillus sp. SDLI1]|uniref:Uncharacterized protein n=1 Tax=Bacillus siamensis TaxID=659243 RepID=A0AAI8HR61_9BACI|nr:hypothetical protein AUL54_08115 [Bacillus sp. SDLI1]AUJ78811.1 hypothetical protein CWD84_19375 [Bacillus siamensis]
MFSNVIIFTIELYEGESFLQIVCRKYQPQPKDISLTALAGMICWMFLFLIKKLIKSSIIPT